LERALARRIQEAIRADACRGREVARLGDLTATLSPDDANPYLNYAIPDEGAAVSRSDVDELIAWYRKRYRRPRLEYLTDLAPAIERELLAAGFEAEGRLPLMTCTSATEEIRPDGVELLVAAEDHEFEGVARVQWEAYESDGPLPDRIAKRLRRTADSGGVVVLARDAATGEPAGAGLVTAPQGGFAELTSVGVRQEFRRHGIAQAVTARLAREGLERGMTCVFLMAMGEDEARIYARAGFVRSSDVLHISLPNS